MYLLSAWVSITVRRAGEAGWGYVVVEVGATGFLYGGEVEDDRWDRPTS